MGCGGSKVDDLPLVKLCRGRKEFIRAAADHRFSLAVAHVSYIRALRDTGIALERFVNEELFVASPSSPIFTVPSSQEKIPNKNSSSSTSLSHSLSHNSPSHYSPSDSHLDFPSGSESGGDGSPEISSPPGMMNYMRSEISSPSGMMNYMKSTAIPSMVYEEQPRSPVKAPWADYSYSNGLFGVSMGSPSYPPRDSFDPERRAVPPPPPSPPKVSTWDFLNPFDSYESIYPVYPQSRYSVGSFGSSPDSKEVREREGIPDLEDEAEHDGEKKPVKESGKGDDSEVEMKQVDNDDGFPQKENKISPPHTLDEPISSKSTEEGPSIQKKGVSFEIETPSAMAGDPSEPHNVMALSTHGTRDMREVVNEIKDHFAAASDSGKEVSSLLEVGRIHYRPKKIIFKVISSRILNTVALRTLRSKHTHSKMSQLSAARVLKLAKANNGDLGKYMGTNSSNLSSTLEKLYVWERKLYAEVKDEEKLRVIYEKKCKRLRVLDDRGAEPDKLDATQASIRKLLTKISITIKAVDTISSRIQKLRDEELKPQLTDFIQGWIKMWKTMLICHQKQCQAIMEGKTLNLVANGRILRDSSMKATMELEVELLNWSSCFSNWIGAQKAYVEALNSWLLGCILQEEEETADGVVPFSPSRVGAPPVFSICNDWYNATKMISETQVTEAMQAFAASLHQLWERQEEQQRQKLKAEYLSKDFEKRLRSLREEESRVHGSQLDKSKTIVSTSKDSGVLLSDRKMDLDSMKKRLDEEMAKHEDAVKQVHEAAFSSLQLGLKPIFEAISNFTSETTRAYKTIRIQNAGET